MSVRTNGPRRLNHLTLDKGLCFAAHGSACQIRRGDGEGGQTVCAVRFLVSLLTVVIGQVGEQPRSSASFS